MNYNIYYQGEKLNKECLSESDIKNIRNRDFIYKMVDDKNRIKISTKNIDVHRCTII